jgi:hypothetical protein
MKLPAAPVGCLGGVAHLVLKVSQVVPEKQVKDEALEQTSHRKKRGYASGPCGGCVFHRKGCFFSLR